MQYAGGHLKELQRAFSKPTANLGLIFEESTKRAKRYTPLWFLECIDLTKMTQKEIRLRFEILGSDLVREGEGLQSLKHLSLALKSPNLLPFYELPVVRRKDQLAIQ